MMSGRSRRNKGEKVSVKGVTDSRRLAKLRKSTDSRGLTEATELMDLVEDRYIEEAAELDGERAVKMAEEKSGGECEAQPRQETQLQNETRPCRKKQLRWKRRTVAAAACLCLLVTGGLLMGGLPGEGTPDSHSRINDPKQSSPAKEGEGIWVPAVELPEPEIGAVYDMALCVVYKGNVYSESGSSQYYGNDAERIHGLLDEYVGEAKGNLTEWSSQSDYAEELAGSASGPVYTVKGYDPKFRVAVGGARGIVILEHLNGIYIDKGAEIFEDYLHLSENGKSISFIDHETWYYADSGEPALTPVFSFDEALWEKFLKEISEAHFEDLQKTDIYDRIAVHLYVTMEDGTVNVLRISRDGYVLYDGLGWYGVKLSEDTLQGMLHACGAAE